MFSLLCPKLFWTVHDEILYKGLSLNEFLRGRIRKLISISFFFISCSFCYRLSFLFLTFFALCPFFHVGSWPVGGGGCPSDNAGEMGTQF